MRDAAWQVQLAIYTALTGDATLVALAPGGIYDHVPGSNESNYPRITIGDDTLIDWDTDTSYGADCTCTVHVWSIEAGREQARGMLSRIAELLHDQRLAVAGFDDVYVRREFEEVLTLQDGATRHGVARYRIVVQER